MKLLVDVGHVSVHLEIVLVSVQDRCTVCAERTVGLKFILVHWEPVSVQDRCMVYAERTVGLKIVLDPPDGTPR